MKCENCECWNEGIPSDFAEESMKDGNDIGQTRWGFCDLHDDVMFADEDCNAIDAEKTKRIPLKGV